jgi:hypothetical protein
MNAASDQALTSLAWAGTECVAVNSPNAPGKWTSKTTRVIVREVSFRKRIFR